MSKDNTSDEQIDEYELKHKLLTLQTPTGRYVIAQLGVNEPESLYTLIDFITNLLEQSNNRARIDETKRWMPISPDPHSSMDMAFMETGKRRIQELQTILNKGGKE